MNRLFLRSVLAACLILSTTIAQVCSAVTIKPGDMVVTCEAEPALFLVDKATGDRTVLSSNSIGTGPMWAVPTDLALESGGFALVADAVSDSLLRVNLTNGNREVLSSASIGSGPAFSKPFGVDFGPNGSIYVSDADAKSIFRIDPVTGDRTIVSSATVGTGLGFGLPQMLAFEHTGKIVMADATGGVWRIDPTTGDRAPLSGGPFGTGTNISEPVGITVAANGTIYVSDYVGSRIFAVDPITGNRIVISNSSDGFGSFAGIDLLPDGNLVGAGHAGLLFRVDLASGIRSPISYISLGTGPNFSHPISVEVVVPEPTALTLLLPFLGVAGLSMRRRSGGHYHS